MFLLMPPLKKTAALFGCVFYGIKQINLILTECSDNERNTLIFVAGAVHFLCTQDRCSNRRFYHQTVLLNQTQRKPLFWIFLKDFQELLNSDLSVYVQQLSSGLKR